MNGAAESSLPKTIALINAGTADGLHVGAQLYASVRGAVVADVALGEARPNAPMRANTLMPWLSCSKPLAAVAVAQLRERGLIDIDDRVAQHIPEFAANGKDVITVRHILTHTAGIRALPPDWESSDWDATIRNVCDAKIEPGWVPGEKAGYHVAASWYILGELVRRLDGRPYRDYVRAAIFLPLGMDDSWIGMSPETYRAYGERIGMIPNTSTAAPRFDPPEKDLLVAVIGRPGGGGRGPMRELARFYEMLLSTLSPSPAGAGEGRGEGDFERREAVEERNHPHPHLLPGYREKGPGILTPQSVRELTTPQRIGMYDHTFRHTMDWGLGFIINSAKYGAETVPYGYGKHASPGTFGHSGAQSSSAFADPAHHLAAAIVWNGMSGEPKHQKRQHETLTALYEDLGFT